MGVYVWRGCSCNNKTLGRVFEIANDLHGQGFGEYGMLVGQQAMAKGSFVTHPEFDRFIRSNGVEGSCGGELDRPHTAGLAQPPPPTMFDLP